MSTYSGDFSCSRIVVSREGGSEAALGKKKNIPFSFFETNLVSDAEKWLRIHHTLSECFIIF